jgi:carbamoyl-phosphate synthase large subunit
MARNQEELRQALDLNDEVIIQELVGRDDTEFTAGALVFDGECKASIVMRRELRDGNTYRALLVLTPSSTTSSSEYVCN